MLEIFETLFAPPRHIIFLVVSAWLGLALAERRAPRYGIERELLSNLIFYALLAYIIGGRLLYAAAHLPAFLASPSSLVSPNTDLFDPLGAAAAAILAAAIFGWQKRLAVWSTLDALTPFLAVMAIGVGLAHLAEGTAFGKPTNLPWAINLWNAHRHPSQIYEILAASLILGIPLLWKSARPGSLFLFFAALSAAARLFLEAYRGDSQLLPGGIRLGQVEAWLALMVVFILLELRDRAPDQPTSRREQRRAEEPEQLPANHN